VIAKGLQPFLRLTGTPIASWLSKPIHQQRAGNVELASAAAVGETALPREGQLHAGGLQASYSNVPTKLQSTPEILGVIPERKAEKI
jgi:hypothetical protein